MAYSYFPDGDQGNVIVLRLATDEGPYLFGYMNDDRLCTFVGALLDHLDQSRNPEFYAIAVKRFSHSISVENQTISTLQADRKIASHPIENASAVNSESHTRRVDLFDRSSRCPVKEGSVMAGASQQEILAAFFHDKVRHADEHVLSDIRVELPVDLV